jgi:hypothetical protein
MVQDYEDILWDEAWEKAKIDVPFNEGNSSIYNKLAEGSGVSETTLSRWKRKNPTRSKNTKNALSKYLGHRNFEGFKKSIDAREEAEIAADEGIVTGGGTTQYTFPQEVANALCDRVGSWCSCPWCSSITKAADLSDSLKVDNIGMASLITPPFPGKPRYNPTFPEPDFLKITNGIWLCPTHEAIVNNGTGGGYTANDLKQWKAGREQFIRDWMDGKITITVTYNPSITAISNKIRDKFDGNDIIESNGFSGGASFMLIVESIETLQLACAFYNEEKGALKDARIKIGKKEVPLEQFVNGEANIFQ